MPAWSLAYRPRSLTAPLQPVCDALLPTLLCSAASAARFFSPDHFRRGITRPVSYYALFKWWLPLSQHPGCQRNSTSFNPLNAPLGALAGGPGCFPFDYGAYPPQSDSRAWRRGIRSSAGFGIPLGTLRRTVALPPRS